MIRYYQTGEYSEWISAPDDNPDDPWAFARKYEAHKVTILAMDADPDITGFDNMRYQGPLFFDIDNGEDLGAALASGVELCRKLLSMGVEENDLEIHLSGSKGIHVFLHPQIFSDNKPAKDLPEIHKRLAISLYVPGMDFQVYSGNKGRQVRPPNSRRDDGRYKVPVTFRELESLTVTGYMEMVKAPRDLPPFEGPKKKSVTLSRLLSNAKDDKTLTELLRPKEGQPENDLSVLAGATPPCVEILARGVRKDASTRKMTEKVTLNQIALNVACWSGNYNVDPAVVDSIQQRIVDNNPSSKGEKRSARLGKLKALHAYVASTKGKSYKFSCGAILKLMDAHPCSQCALKVSLNQNTISNHLFIHEKGGQWFSDEECSTVVSTFTLERDAVIKDENTKVIQSSVIDMVIPAQGRVHRLHDFPEDAWRNKNSFKEAIQGFDGAAFFGSDNDVARLRLTIAKNELLSGAEMKEQFKSEKIGIIYRRRSGPENATAEGHLGRLTYVEENFSTNSSWIHGTHRYAGAPQQAPKLGRLDWSLPISEDANYMFGLLLRCNYPSVIAPMLGWYLLAHIKTHLYQVEHRGALLCISGVAGTGKNSLTAVMQRLSGLQGEAALFTLEAPNSTKMPFQQALSNSTTIPRVINELNPKSVTRRHYQDLMEILKAAFDSQSISRGRIGGNSDRGGANVSTVSWQITAPVITLSEEPIHLPAIRQRAVMVDMTPQGHDFGSDAFMPLERDADLLVDIARVLVKGALNTSVMDISNLLRSTDLPPEMDYYDIPSRLKFGYRSILMAYDWAIKVLGANTGFSEGNLEGLQAMRENFIEYMQMNSQRIARDSNVTEVDKVLRDLAIMAYSHNGTTGASYTLERNKHYVMMPDLLYLDMLVIYPLYQRFKAGSPENMSIVTPEAFLQVVRSMSYYVSDRAITDLLPTNGRPVLSLDVKKMQEKDIPVTMFN